MSDRESASENSESGKYRRLAEVDAFRRSRSTKRSPPKNTDSADVLVAILEQNKALLEEIKHLRADMATYKEELNDLRAENKELKLEVRSANNKIEALDKYIRRKRLIFRGLPRLEEPVRPAVEKFVEENLGVQVNLVEAKFIGGGRVCVVETESMDAKIEIIKNKKKLKEKKSRVFIDNDLTPLEREVQNEIYKTFKTEKENGNNAKMGYRKLTVNEQLFVWNNESKQLMKKN